MSQLDFGSEAIPGQLREITVDVRNGVNITTVNYFPAYLLIAPCAPQIAISWNGRELHAKIHPTDRDFFPLKDKKSLPIYANTPNIVGKVVEWFEQRPNWRELVTLLFRINDIRFGALTPPSAKSTPESAS